MATQTSTKDRRTALAPPLRSTLQDGTVVEVPQCWDDVATPPNVGLCGIEGTYTTSDRGKLSCLDCAALLYPNYDQLQAGLPEGWLDAN